MPSWNVYIVQCADQSLYTGVAIDVATRIAQHNAGRGAKYTRARLPVELVHIETDMDRQTAQRREHAIKKMQRIDKLNLIDPEFHLKLVPPNENQNS